MSAREFSIIVCTHNRADLLPGLIGRLRRQAYPPDAFEIIIVDNNSTDSTPQIVRQFSTEPGAAVRYISENSEGIAVVRNRGAREARFPYLAYLDDDCRVEPDWLDQLNQGFDFNDRVVVVGGRVVLDWSNTNRPAWLGTGLDTWLGSNGHLGDQLQILDEKNHILEGNMAVKKETWHSSGGFLGMEQFGSRNMASGEVLYLLHQVRRQGGLVAYAPQAVASHRMGDYTRLKLLQRGYWQGVSTGILDYLTYQRPWPTVVYHILLDAAAALILFCRSCLHFLILDQANGICYLVRSARRFSLVLTGMRLTGDWASIHSWESVNRPIP